MKLHHLIQPAANKFLPQIQKFLVPTWYRQLRIEVRKHIESGTTPLLSLAPKPDTSKQWQIRQEIIAEMRNEVNTFELIETGDALDQEIDIENGEVTSDEDWDY